MLKRYLYHIYILLFFPVLVHAYDNGNNYVNPMSYPVALSGNFGELRTNHFHSGLDYKTGGIENRPVVSIADGYVSRVVVSPVGYGKAIYITHPATGQMSVYGHLNKFTPGIDSLVRAYQYKFQTFPVNVAVKGINVKQGELIAYSGNTGSSGGPHLHFEIRDAENTVYIDPLNYRMGVADNVKPRLMMLKVYPQTGEGVVEMAGNNKTYHLSDLGNGAYTCNTIKAWGKLGLGIRAFDFASASHNVLGVTSIRIEVDNKEIYHYQLDKLNINDSRYINSFIDYAELKSSKLHFMKSFIDPGNKLDVYKNVIDNGFITISEERDYKVKYTLSDTYGNTSVLNFTIRGEKALIPEKPECINHMPHNVINRFETEDVCVSIPKDFLYTDICFEYSVDSCKNGCYSHFYQLHSDLTPLHDFIDVSIKPIKPVSETEAQKLYAVRYGSNGGTQAYAGEYVNNMFSFKTRDFGKFVLKTDTIAPEITPLNLSKSILGTHISFRITDAMSGIDTYNGYIDGKWVLFEYDLKTKQIKYYLNENDMKRKQQHKLELIVTDVVGNKAILEKDFFW